MSETKFTPGPWIRLYDDRVSTPDDLNGAKSICHIYESNGKRDANARLIAAAPELLEACRLLIERYEPDGPSCDPPNPEECGLCFAHAAILKATGSEAPSC